MMRDNSSDHHRLLKRKCVSFTEGDVSVSYRLLQEPLTLSYPSLKELMVRELHHTLFVFLKSRSRSIWECRKKLETAQFLDQEIQEGLDFFQRKSWINDAQFSKLLLESVQSRKAIGYRAMKYKLQEKHIDSQIIEQVLENYGKQFLKDGAVLLKKQSHRFHKYEGWEKKKKMFAYLYQRGFSGDEIEEILRKA